MLRKFLPSLPSLFYWRMVFDRSLTVTAIPTLRGAGVASLIVFVEFHRAERETIKRRWLSGVSSRRAICPSAGRADLSMSHFYPDYDRPPPAAIGRRFPKK